MKTFVHFCENNPLAVWAVVAFSIVGIGSDRLGYATAWRAAATSEERQVDAVFRGLREHDDYERSSLEQATVGHVAATQ